ncbi:hypothetical protein GCM10009828_017960 [Actinoplanes couchii]|uniref:Lipoprotein n=1 Tax=Actinoplanes couchii TaxID=403638 RepID=A0ABQ3XE53_9ACTN|nr:hypothetical protein Aco03nite_051720 [Actinoplanes couchii]
MSIVGLSLAVVAALGGCGDDAAKDSTSTGTTETGTSAAAPTDAAPVPAGALGELVAAAEKTTSTSAKVAMKSGSVTIDGAFDAPGELVEMDSDFGDAGTIKILRVGNDLYLKAGGSIAASYSGNGKKWLHVDASKQTGTLSVEQNDPSSTAKLLSTAASDVTGSGGSYQGTLDMSKSPTVSSAVGSAGDKFKAIPFTAEVKDGYLTKVTTDMSKVAQGAGKSVTAYSGFGAPVDVKAPAAAQTMEMSAADIKKMGG